MKAETCPCEHSSIRVLQAGLCVCAKGEQRGTGLAVEVLHLLTSPVTRPPTEKPTPGAQLCPAKLPGAKLGLAGLSSVSL